MSHFKKYFKWYLFGAVSVLTAAILPFFVPFLIGAIGALAASPVLAFLGTNALLGAQIIVSAIVGAVSFLYLWGMDKLFSAHSSRPRVVPPEILSREPKNDELDLTHSSVVDPDFTRIISVKDVLPTPVKGGHCISVEPTLPAELDSKFVKPPIVPIEVSPKGSPYLQLDANRTPKLSLKKDKVHVEEKSSAPEALSSSMELSVLKRVTPPSIAAVASPVTIENILYPFNNHAAPVVLNIASQAKTLEAKPSSLPTSAAKEASPASSLAIVVRANGKPCAKVAKPSLFTTPKNGGQSFGSFGTFKPHKRQQLATAIASSSLGQNGFYLPRRKKWEISTDCGSRLVLRFGFYPSEHPRLHVTRSHGGRPVKWEGYLNDKRDFKSLADKPVTVREIEYIERKEVKKFKLEVKEEETFRPM